MVCSTSGYYVIYILYAIEFIIFNQWLFHLRIPCYLYFICDWIHDFKSVFVPSQDTMLFIFYMRLNSWFSISGCSTSGYYVIYILYAFEFMILNQSLFHLRILCYLYFICVWIHDFQSVVVPPQDTMLFIFYMRLNS